MSDLNESAASGTSDPVMNGAMLLGASSARVELLRLVLTHGELTALEIMDAIQMTRNGVGKHLDELTAEGFLIARRATHPRGVCGVIYWRANRERIAAELWAFTGALLGYEGQSNSVG